MESIAKIEPDSLIDVYRLNKLALLCELMSDRANHHKSGCYNIRCEECVLQRPEEFEIWKATKRIIG